MSVLPPFLGLPLIPNTRILPTPQQLDLMSELDKYKFVTTRMRTSLISSNKLLEIRNIKHTLMKLAYTKWHPYMQHFSGSYTKTNPSVNYIAEHFFIHPIKG
jgi:hypothetical protein